MDCGILFCYGLNGCLVNNQILDWNDLVFQGDWDFVFCNFYFINNFFEFIGWICFVFCEEVCMLNLEDILVNIKSVEQVIVDKGFEEGWIVFELFVIKIGKVVVIIGFGLVGMVVVQQLVWVGYMVYVYECELKVGGLLCYGIFDFKMEKYYIDCCVIQMEVEGVMFYYGVDVGVMVSLEELVDCYDVVILCVGVECLCDLGVEGMDL